MKNPLTTTSQTMKNLPHINSRNVIVSVLTLYGQCTMYWNKSDICIEFIHYSFCHCL